MFRRVEKLIEQIYESIKKKNWSLKFINLQVKNEFWLLERYKKFAKEFMQISKQQEKENELQ